MSESSTVTASALAPRLRHMSKDELPDLSPVNPRSRRQDGAGDTPEAGCLRERVGWVAEVRGRVAGSLIYDVVQPSGGPRGANSHCSLMDLLLWLLGGCGVQPLQVEVLDVTIAPAPYWEAVERALLGRLVEELQCSCGRARWCCRRAIWQFSCSFATPGTGRFGCCAATTATRTATS